MKRLLLMGISVLFVGLYMYHIQSKTTTHRQQKGSAMVTESGLKYIITQEAPADAVSPRAGQSVMVHYTGWLEENGKPGKKFDSSIDRGQPFQFTIGVGQVIKGWDEGVMQMKIGEKRRLIIPAALGYGVRGAGGVIPPNATLIFDVELIDIK